MDADPILCHVCAAAVLEGEVRDVIDCRLCDRVVCRHLIADASGLVMCKHCAGVEKLPDSTDVEE